MSIAIYSRKSKITESGDSVGNQVEMCKEYARIHFSGNELIVYEDEGYSGGSTDRPMFKKLQDDIIDRKIDTLICYRLDRISRNVADFSILLSMLSARGIGFVSIKERFDTTTPMGKAMMYIASVFAQLERDTIAERIKDNLFQLAKKGSGRYLNGNAPEGYELIKSKNFDGRTFSILKQKPSECDKVRLIYEKYIETKSLNKVALYLTEQNIKTSRGNDFTPDGVRRILLNPVYVVANNDIYDYYNALGAQFSAERIEFADNSEANGKGVSVFKRNSRTDDISKWVIGIGAHEAIVSSFDWLFTREILNEQHSKTYKKTNGHHGLLNGLLVCANCGGYIRPCCIRKNKNGQVKFYYVCQAKEASRGLRCKNKNIRGDILDTDVYNTLFKRFNNTELIRSQLNTLLKNISVDKKETDSSKRVKLANDIKRSEMAIHNLLCKLEERCGSVIDEYINIRINELDTHIKSLKQESSRLFDSPAKTQSQNYPADIQEISSKIVRDILNTACDSLLKRKLLRPVIQNIKCDGTDAIISFAE